MFNNINIKSFPDQVLGALRLTGRFGVREERRNLTDLDWSSNDQSPIENTTTSFVTSNGSNGSVIHDKMHQSVSINGFNGMSCDRYSQGRPSIAYKPDQPRISSWDAGWNVQNAIQGMFVLGLPYAVLHGGYLSLFLIILTAVVCCYTGEILVDCLYETTESGIKYRVMDTYVDIAQHCWGRRVGLWIVNVNQLIELLMTCVLYIVISGNLMASSFPHASINEQGWSVIAAFILAPCIFLRNLRTVSKLSMGCSMAQVVVLGVTIIYCFTQVTHWHWKEISIGVDVQRFPVSIGVIVFSYTSQIFLPSLEGNMQYRESFKPMLYWSYAAACASKTIFALICYLTWAHETKEVITDNLPAGFRSAINVMLVVKALLSYPLPYYASVEVLEQTIFTGPLGGVGSLLHTKSHSYGKLSDTSDASSTSESENNNVKVKTRDTVYEEPKSFIHPHNETQEDNGYTFPSCYSPSGDVQLWAYGLRAALVLGTLIMAVCIPHFALLMGLTGSLTGSSLAFLLPTLFHLQIRWQQLSWKNIFLNFFIFIMGVIVSVTGIYHSIQGLYYSYHPKAHLLNNTTLYTNFSSPYSGDSSNMNSSYIGNSEQLFNGDFPPN